MWQKFYLYQRQATTFEEQKHRWVLNASRASNDGVLLWNATVYMQSDTFRVVVRILDKFLIFFFGFAALWACRFIGRWTHSCIWKLCVWFAGRKYKQFDGVIFRGHAGSVLPLVVFEMQKDRFGIQNVSAKKNSIFISSLCWPEIHAYLFEFNSFCFFV